MTMLADISGPEIQGDDLGGRGAGGNVACKASTATETDSLVTSSNREAFVNCT